MQMGIVVFPLKELTQLVVFLISSQFLTLTPTLTMTKAPANEFTPRDNPAFILHGKLSTSYETVGNPLELLLTV